MELLVSKNEIAPFTQQDALHGFHPEEMAGDAKLAGS